LHEVLDAGLICHLAMLVDGSPVVLPTGHGRDGDTLYLHGSSGARSMREAATGIDVCVAVTIVDGVVYARSTNHHSMNYRSAVVHGVAKPVTEREAKLRGLRAITDHLAPGSWEHARQPNKRELAGVTVLALELTEASVKVRSGPPGDDEEDIEAGVAWAGVLPVRQVWGEPESAPDLPDDMAVPEHVLERPSR
jgi:nitroimidazol reductase NimA-like FMN-containing flavoprotein (pyridoxamine 5'-phosphate oxidase superfamily)